MTAVLKCTLELKKNLESLFYYIWLNWQLLHYVGKYGGLCSNPMSFIPRKRRKKILTEDIEAYHEYCVSAWEGRCKCSLLGYHSHNLNKGHTFSSAPLILPLCFMVS